VERFRAWLRYSAAKPVFILEESAMIPGRRFRFSAFAVLFLAGTLPVLAQNQTVNLIGEIKISRGSFPPHRIEVTLETRGLPGGVTYADDEGKFLFRDLSPNLYYIVIRDSDFEPVRERIQIQELSGTSMIVQILLTPKESVRPRGTKDTTSGGNPFIVDRSEYEKRYPKDATKEFDRGNRAARENATDEALRHFEKAVSLAPDFYAARNNLGLIHLARKNFEGAEQQFREVVRLNPSDSQAYFNLGNAYLLKQEFPEALETIKDGLQRQPDSIFGQFLLATAYSRTGNRPQAEKIFQQLLTTNPGMSKAHLELVNLYLQENRNSEAVAELKAFLKASPEDPFAPKAREVLSRLERQPAPKQ
jgi:Flp pilus assembly protein TadD